MEITLCLSERLAF